MDYLAIDFETANGNLTSACSIGLVGVTNDKIEFEKYYLINPEEEFSINNVFIHGITAKDVEDAMTFDKVWEEIKQYFNNTVVFAHAASFDIGVLKALVEKYNLEVPNIKIGCTLKIAKKIWNDTLPNCKLNTISNYLEVDHRHHNAISDAYVCTQIIKRAKINRNVSSELELYDVLGLTYGIYNCDCYKSSSSRLKKGKGKLIDNSLLKDKVVAYSGKPLSMTRKEFHNKLLINGALIASGPVASVDYFIILEGYRRTQLQRIEDYIDKGFKMKIIDEEEIMRMLK